MGAECVEAIAANFCEVTEGWGDCPKGLLLLVLGRVVLPSQDMYAEHAHWLANFITASHPELTWCALQSLSHMNVDTDSNPMLEVHVPAVASLLASPLLRAHEQNFDTWEVIVAASRFLCSLDPFRHMDVAMTVVTALPLHIDEEHAKTEMRSFSNYVCQRHHGAYSHFTKRPDSCIQVFSRLFNKLGYNGIAAMEKADLLASASDCQKAFLLLCAASPMNTFNRADGKACAWWILPHLRSASWEVRVAALHCLQRLMAGYMGPEPHAHAVASLLKDEASSVRASAASILGCLGRRASRYEKELLSLLEDTHWNVRYASLVTLGGLMAAARPHASKIACRLNDAHSKCRMAALRALKCMGKTAAPYRDQLLAWQKQWYAQSSWVGPDSGKKLEPITTRALLFPNAFLKHLFKGHAPLGRGYAGPKTIQSQRKEVYKTFMSRGERDRVHVMHDDENISLILDRVELKEARGTYRDVQLGHCRALMWQRQLEKENRQQKKSMLYLQSQRRERAKGSSSYVRAPLSCMEDWVLQECSCRRKIGSKR